MHESNELAQHLKHATVYAQLIVTFNGPKICICANSEYMAMTTDLMVISYYNCLSHCRNMLRLCFGTRTQVLVAKCSPCIALSVLPHVKHIKALYSVYSIKPKTNANMSRTHRLNY